MKKFILFVLLCLMAFAMFGCSGGGMFGSGGSGGRAGAKDNTGSMTLTVNWPGVEPSDAGKSSILTSAYSIKVNVCAQVLQDGVTKYNREVNTVLIVRRTSTAATESATINGIPAGAKTVIAQAYDSSASQIGYGTRDVTVIGGDNNAGITISLARGTFPYSIIGPGDVTTPTSGSSGGGGGGGGGGGNTTNTVTHSFMFVNNFEGDSISVIDEKKTTASGGGSTTVTTVTYPQVQTISGVPRPYRGVFDDTGNYYYVISYTGSPNLPNSPGYAIYKIGPLNNITNSTNWSSFAPQLLTQFDFAYMPVDIVYEKDGTNEYLYVAINYSNYGYPGTLLRRININNPQSFIERIFSITGYNYEGFALYKIPNTTGKLAFVYASSASFYASAVYVETSSTGNPYISASGGEPLGSPITKLAGAYPVLGLTGNTTTDSTSTTRNEVYIPRYDGLNIFEYKQISSTSYVMSPVTLNSFPYVITNARELFYNNTTYGINGNSLQYSMVSPPTLNWTMAGSTLGASSTTDLADMALSYDLQRIYISDFGPPAYANNKIYVKNIFSITGMPTTITVGSRPLGITIKPGIYTETGASSSSSDSTTSSSGGGTVARQ